MSTSNSAPHASSALSIVPNRHEVAVVPAGNLDLPSADDVSEAVVELWTAGFHEVVLDLRQVELIDSAGLRTLLSLRNHAKRNRRGLALVRPRSAAARIFELTATRGLFDWHDRSWV
jgi:anti-anti-sigma factor